MSGFDSPNYTQIPNDFFEKLPMMGEAEVKVVCALMRATFGYHRQTVRMSIRKLARATGLTAKSVYAGAEDAIKRGIVRKENDGGVTVWSIVVNEETVIPSITPNPKSVIPSITPSIKEKRLNKKSRSEKDAAKITPFQMAEAVAEVCEVEVTLLAGQLCKNGKSLLQAGYSPDQVRQLYGKDGWWYQKDYRGKSGSPPNVATINQTIKQARKWLLEKETAVDDNMVTLPNGKRVPDPERPNGH